MPSVFIFLVSLRLDPSYELHVLLDLPFLVVVLQNTMVDDKTEEGRGQDKGSEGLEDLPHAPRSVGDELAAHEAG